jgi:putative photosynthetic complex assembly protein 2
MTEFFASAPGAALVAVFSWWLGTGAILWLVRLPARRFRTSMTVLTYLLLLSLVGAAWSMREPSVAGAYTGFLCVIVMWSWHEMAFLSGWITGPRRIAQDPHVRGWQRFSQAVAALLHHELALIVNFAVLLGLQWNQPSHVALCTFTLLWCMRVSSKFNLFFGVPNVGEQYLPAHLKYLGSYFRRSDVTGYFYFSVGLSIGTWVWMVWEVQQGAMKVSTGWVLLASLLGLAIVEHLLMVIAVPLQRLWGWAMRQAGPAASAEQDLPQASANLPSYPDRA